MNGPIIAYRGNIGVQTSAPFANISSLLFDGVDDYVQTSASTSGDITLSAWVDCNGTYTANASVFPISIRVSNTNVPNATLGRLYKQGTSLWVSLQMYDQNGANFSTYTARGVLLEGAGWKHLCWTYDNTTKQVYLYIDGVVQTWTNFGGTITTPYLTAAPTHLYNSPLFMGAYNNTEALPFNGNVDEVCILDRIATPTEIATLSTAPTVSLTSLNPIAWYRNGDNGSWKSPQWLIPNNENFAANKVSNYSTQFDGIDDYLNIGTSLNLGTDSTISMWIKRGRVSTLEVLLAEATYSYDAMVYIDTGNNIFFKIGTAYLLFNNSPISTILNDTTNWINICFVRSGNSVELFLNGVSMQIRTGFGTSVDTRFDTIGAKPDGSFATLGNIDEVGAWNVNIIIPSDIYNGGTPTTISGAAAHWKMGENSTFLTNWTVPDEVGSNNGTSVNMTIEDRIGEAPNSENNAVSLNMDEVDRTTDVPT